MPLLTLAAAQPCALSGRVKELAATIGHGETFGLKDVDPHAPVFRGVAYDRACADQAVAWLGSDDLTERLAGAAYYARYRIQDWTRGVRFLLFFRMDVADRNFFFVGARERIRWEAQARGERSLAVVLAKYELLFRVGKPGAEAARYLLDTRRLIRHEPLLMLDLERDLDWAKDMPLRPDDLDFLWAHRDDRQFAFGALHVILARYHDPREKKLVERLLPKAGFGDLHDRDDLLQRAYDVGLGDRMEPVLLKLARRQEAKHLLCLELDDFIGAAAGHLPSIRVLLKLGQDCHGDPLTSLSGAIRATPNPETSLRTLLPEIQRIEGDRMWIFGLPVCIAALPPEPTPGILRAIAEAVAQQEPRPIWSRLEEVIDAREKTANPADLAALRKLRQDLESRALGKL